MTIPYTNFNVTYHVGVVRIAVSKKIPDSNIVQTLCFLPLATNLLSKVMKGMREYSQKSFINGNR